MDNVGVTARIGLAAAVMGAITLLPACAPFGSARGIPVAGDRSRGGPSVNSSTLEVLRGQADFGPARQVQATMTEIASGSVVSLLDPLSGNTVASSLTDGSGSFVLSFPADFAPADGAAYTLEAVKGLAVGGQANRAGTTAARIRTILVWDAASAGWQSLTNTAVNTGIVVSPATTAVAIIASLLRNQGIGIAYGSLVGTVSGSAFADPGTGISSVNDFNPVLADVNSAIALDQDPVAAIGYHKQDGTYTLATDVPLISSLSPSIPTPGGIVTLQGANFDPSPGRNAFYFGTDPASTWSVSADRTSATVSIPAGAYSAPFLLQQPGGVVDTLSPMLGLQGTVGTIAGSGVAGWTDGPRQWAEFNSPEGLAFDPDGNLYVADTGNDAIRRIGPEGTVSTLAGGSQGAVDGAGSGAQFDDPYSLAADAAGNLFVADAANHEIREVTPYGVVSTVAGSGNPGFADGIGAAAAFYYPEGLAVDASGDIYVADAYNNRIRKIAPGNVVTTIAGNGTGAWLDGTGSGAEFYHPGDIVLDGLGNAYIADSANQRIRKLVLSSGVVTTVAGSGTQGSLDGTGTGATFAYPYQLALDPTATDLYVSDYNGAEIRRIVLSTGVVTTVGGNGGGGWIPAAGYVDGAFATSKLSRPCAVALDANGNVYVADAGNNRIRVATP